MLVMRAVAADMRRSGRRLAPPQMGSLMRMAAGPCTMSELARHQAVSLPTVSKSVDTLVRRGWVERWIDQADRRQTLVRLTPRGRRVLYAMRRRAERRLADVLAPLTPGDRAQLVHTVDRLSRVLATAADGASCAAAAGAGRSGRRTLDRAAGTGVLAGRGRR